MKKSIAFIHLLNDYSGSPRVLQSVIKSTIKEGNEVKIMTSGREGFLSNIHGATYTFLYYRFFKNKAVALTAYLLWQLQVFVKVLLLPARYKIIYINTMHPFGAALAGIVRRNKIIYHIHETSIKPVLLKKWLRWIITFSARDIIFVSKYLKKSEDFPGKRTHVVYNALNEEFQSIKLEKRRKNTFEVLMLCSLKKYKGVDEFLKLAQELPAIKFTLVLNTRLEEISEYYDAIEIPPNLSLHPATKEVHPFYTKSDLVINLSHRDKWIETFGMTIAEAFSYSIPVIVPEVGGIAELVENGQNGYRLNHDKTAEICHIINDLARNFDRYTELSVNAYKSSKRFNNQYFSKAITTILYS